MRKYLTLLLLGFTVIANATHIVGGFISYSYISGNTYEVKLTIYKDCNSSTPFDATAYLGIYNNNSGFVVNTVGLTNPVITTIQPPNNNPCLTNTSGACVQQGVYTANITLPNGNNTYTLVHERCCRNGTITNVSNPGDQGAAYSAVIPPTNTYHNTSPVFNSFPPLFICVNSALILNNSATDADGDLLTYSLCTPSIAGDPSPTGAAPNPPLGPPYANLPWQSPYSLANLLGGSQPLTINSQTGVLTGTPGTVGQFVVGVCISEFRNGVLLGTYLRDFQFNVTQCNIPIPNIPSSNINPSTGIGLYVQNCKNYTVTFQNNTYNPPPTNVPLDYEWDFGVANITTDTSSAKFPVYVYPDTGTYLVRLVATKSNGSQPCTDTTYAYVKIYPSFLTGFITADICQKETATFTDTTYSQYGTINKWNWSFGDGSTDTLTNPVHHYATPGTYPVTLINSNTYGCKDTAVKNIVVNESPSAAFTMSNGCINQPVNFTFTGTGTINTYDWNFGDGATDNQTSPTHTYTALGTYDVKLITTETSGCADTVQQSITINPVPDVNATNDTSLCQYVTTLQLEAHDGATYAWAPATGLSDPNIANPIATLTVPNSSSYTVTVTNQFQCSSTDAVTISYYPATQTVAGPDTSVCLNPGSYRDTVQINATGAATYFWTPATGLNSVTAASPIAKPTVNTTYFVTGTDANGCVSGDSVVVYVLDPAINIVIDDQANVCVGDTVYINVINQGASNYSWTPSQFIVDPQAYSPGFYPAVTTTYTLNVNNYCYNKNDSVQIIVRPLPTLVINPLDSVCDGDSIQLSVGGAQSYVWDADPTLSDTGGTNPFAHPVTATTYYVTGTSIYGCVNRDSTLITIHALPYVNAGNDTLIWRDTKAYIHATTVANNFTWSPVTDLSDVYSLTTEANPIQSITYVLSVIDDFGCRNVDSLLITVEKNIILDIPTGFSPNGDGINDVFHIVRSLDIEKLKEFSVYNRWGNKVFSTTDITEGWDGTYQGHEQGIGTYVWYVVALTKEKEEILRKGNVTLVR